tara:strand:- start:85 stop:1512 length:1428 start_codon:yes stop_codon:yes gene_type:complete
MAITVPPQNKQAFEAVMSALGGDDYSYYLFDVKNIEEKDSTKKVQVALKVFVPATARLGAVDNIVDALENQGYMAKKNAKGTSLDVILPDREKEQVIRIEVKPEGSKGSGGGSAATAIQEAAQCVYAAMRYYCPNIENKEVFTEDDFKCGLKHCDIPKVSLKEIMSLPKEWKESSWMGAQEIYNKVGGSGWLFVRGDNVIDDGAIKKAFKRVKDQTNLSSEDKWNPADIWMVNKNAKGAVKAHLDKEKTIDCLNNALLQLSDPQVHKLVGISLKKIEGKPKMKEMNAIPAAARKANEKAGYVKYDLTFDNGRKGDSSHPMDVYLYYGSGTFDKFQARNFGGPTKGDWKLELKGKSAAQGKIQGAVLRRLLSDAGFKTVPGEPSWAESAPGKKAVSDEIYKLLNNLNAKGFKKSDPKGEQYGWIDQADQAWRYSKLAGLRLLSWVKSHPKKDTIMKEMYLYASSQSDKSSVYWKLQ